MKSTLVLLALQLAAVSAFTVPVPSLARRTCDTVQKQGSISPTSLASDKKEGEEETMDLNLEEMFTMFEAADKEEDFDKAIKKVKEQ